jgi:hypothetical protein
LVRNTEKKIPILKKIAENFGSSRLNNHFARTRGIYVLSR